MIQPGQIAFFKNCSVKTYGTPDLGFKGHGFGIFLGVVPPFGKEPTEEQIMIFLGQIGFISYDQLARVMGAEMVVDLMKKIDEKRSEMIKEETPKLELAKEPEL